MKSSIRKDMLKSLLPDIMDFVAQIGKVVIDSLAYLGALATLIARAAFCVFIGPFQKKPIRWRRVINQAAEVGVRALPILSLITFFIGLILALQFAIRVAQIGSDESGRHRAWPLPSRANSARSSPRFL